MKREKGLFVVVRNYGCLEDGRVSLSHRIVSKLRDYRALGYRVIGILSDKREDDGAALTLDFEFDDLYRAGEVDDTSFPDVAWSVARRYNINVRRSMLTSANPSHEMWARNAGMNRFDLAAHLFGT